MATEVKNNVKWLKNGLIVGFGYHANEEGYIDPKSEMELRSIDEKGKEVVSTVNTIKHLTKENFIEVL